jgi:diaminopimelate epimerase
MKIPFTKCHANGNDFILILEKNFPKKIPKQTVIKTLCNRNIGIGADGLLIISKSDKYDFSLDYYNSDGSWESLCANGSRCACLAMYLNNKVKKNVFFEAGDGVHRAIIDENNIVSMSMAAPKYKSKFISPEGCDGYFINSGAPHYVTELQNLKNTDALINTAKNVRFNKCFFPGGVNVNFFNKRSKKSLNILTYEKV